ncbi:MULTISPECIES: glyoxalase superfamily protein [unclassified Duganella]|uniref:glyoxalase superfamily protein n=1 Tax=unclassified Duganella TaxID=2636909 RepID=UPI000E347267|nr:MULTISPECIES: glyoxalase superfamily protein [unclassified Duganella]RFP19356.1 VOC family protein [Duganella sp. BJB475]RFP35937.1 VOC family protein [Duganella sp. BJB476]
MNLSHVTPVLRSCNEAQTREFYVDFLGFKVDWEHRFEPVSPLYMQVSKGDCILHLTEHFGDCNPGGAIRIATVGLDEFHAELIAKQFKYARPGIGDMPWGSREMSITDPSGNRLTFVATDGNE